MDTSLGINSTLANTTITIMDLLLFLTPRVNEGSILSSIISYMKASLGTNSLLAITAINPTELLPFITRGPEVSIYSKPRIVSWLETSYGAHSTYTIVTTPDTSSTNLRILQENILINPKF